MLEQPECLWRFDWIGWTEAVYGRVLQRCRVMIGVEILFLV